MADELIRLDKNARWVLSAIDADTDEIRNLHMDDSNRGLYTNLWVWDSGGGDWAKMAQPATVDPIFGDYFLEISKGNVAGHGHENKFGRSTNVDNGINTDIWDGANPTDDIDIWVAPTQARTHQIVSTSGSDDGNPVGVGARTIRVFGLTGWGASEVSEDITMNGMTNVPTVNSYVIIHRILILTKGATNTNVGVITATADVDGTVTAQVNAGKGQTQMAIYGIPSTQKAYMVSYYASALKTGQGASVDVSLLVNPEPDSELTNFLVKHTNGLPTGGSSYVPHFFKPYFNIDGPAIIKIQGNSSANDTDVSAGFDLILVDN